MDLGATRTVRLRYDFEDQRPVDPIDWRDEWVYIPTPKLQPDVPFKPMRHGLGWLVPVITQIKIQTNLDFQSHMFGPELLTSTGGGRYQQGVLIVPSSAQTQVQSDVKDAIWHWRDETDWMAMAVVETEGDPVITPPAKEYIESMTLPILRDCFLMISWRQQHEIPAVIEGYPPPVGVLWITFEMHWEKYDNFTYSVMRTRETMPRLGL